MKRTRLLWLLEEMLAHVCWCDGCSVSKYLTTSRDTRCKRGRAAVAAVARELRRRFGR